MITHWTFNGRAFFFNDFPTFALNHNHNEQI